LLPIIAQVGDGVKYRKANPHAQAGGDALWKRTVVSIIYDLTVIHSDTVVRH